MTACNEYKYRIVSLTVYNEIDDMVITDTNILLYPFHRHYTYKHDRVQVVGEESSVICL